MSSWRPDSPVELLDGTLCCKAHHRVYCVECCVDYSFMQDSCDENEDSSDEDSSDQTTGFSLPQYRLLSLLCRNIQVLSHVLCALAHLNPLILHKPSSPKATASFVAQTKSTSSSTLMAPVSTTVSPLLPPAAPLSSVPHHPLRLSMALSRFVSKPKAHLEPSTHRQATAPNSEP